MPTTVDFPTLVKQALALFGDVFDNEPARRHFAEYLTGLMVAERKNISARGKSRISRGGIILTAVTKAWVTSLRSTSRSPVRKLHDTQAINRPLKRSNSRQGRAV